MTLPSRQTVVQLAAGMYRRMGLEEMIAIDVQDYVRRAVQAGTNKTHRLELSERIQSRVGILYEDVSVVGEWERLLMRLVEAAC